MSHTNTFKDTLLGETSITHTPIYYVGYYEPTQQDEAWSLEVRSVNLTRMGVETEYLQMTWSYLRDEQALIDYPIFHELANEYNWHPLTPVTNTY